MMRFAHAVVILSVGLSCDWALAQTDPLEKGLMDQAAAKAPGATHVGELYRGAGKKKGERTDWKVELEADKCYWFSAQAEPSVTSLSLFLFSPDENAFSGRLATERGKTNQVIMSHCVTKSGMHRLQAKILEGSGAYAVGIFEKAAPKKDDPFAKLTPLVEKEAAVAAKGASRDGDFFTGSGDTTSWDVMLKAGTCYWLVAVGEKSISELYLYLWDQNKKRLNENRNKSNKSTIAHCVKETGIHRFELKVNSGSGNYAAALFAKAP